MFSRQNRKYLCPDFEEKNITQLFRLAYPEKATIPSWPNLNIYNCFKSPVLRNVDEKHSPLFSLSQGYSSREGWIMQLIKLTWAKLHISLVLFCTNKTSSNAGRGWHYQHLMKITGHLVYSKLKQNLLPFTYQSAHWLWEHKTTFK